MPFDSVPQTITEADVIAVRKRAAELIERYGWCKDRYVSYGKMCISAALCAAALELTRGFQFALAPTYEDIEKVLEPRTGRATDLMREACVAMGFHHRGTVANWNDHYRRSPLHRRGVGKRLAIASLRKGI